VTFELMQ